MIYASTILYFCRALPPARFSLLFINILFFPHHTEYSIGIMGSLLLLSVLLSLSTVVTNALSLSGTGLNDNPIVGDTVTYLDSEEWTITSNNPSYQMIRGTVPGDLVTDIYQAGLMGDPIYELNWLNYATIWADNTWTYSTEFTLSAEDIQSIETSANQVFVVFDGIKMPSTVMVNGLPLGNTTDQFLRYNFSIAQAHRDSGNTLLRSTGTNVLSVVFDPTRNDSEGRFAADSGGWDWAPYSLNFSMGYGASGPTPARYLTKGIYKSVYLVTVSTAAITHFVPHVYYNGVYPTAPLTDNNNGGFTVVLRTYLWSAGAVTGTVSVTGSWSGAPTANTPVSLNAGENSVVLNLTANAGSFSLWWPNGLGAQPLYTVSTTFTPTGSATGLTTIRQIGFRFAVYVTGNDTDPNWVNANMNADGSANQGMLFRVNGAAIFSRGANMIPPDVFEGRYSIAAISQMVRSAAEANFNFLRVWGGGLFLPSIFYDSCDANGILIFHDMMYAQDGHSPNNQSLTQELEFRHQIRRLSAHPSIMLFGGCNECHVIIGTDTGVYATFVMTIVAQEDTSRIIVPSCPSAGWSAGVNRLTGFANGSPLGLLPNAHGPVKVNDQVTGNCTFTQDTDVSGVDGSSSPGTNPQDCCNQCANDASCFSVVYYQNTCWKKDAGGVNISNPGRVLCMPANKHSIRTIELHGPYQGGEGYPAVNGGATFSFFSSGYPLTVNPQDLSLYSYSIFASEFGAAVYSSYESMAPTLAPEHHSTHGGAPPDTCGSGFEKLCNGTNVMAQRNYPGDGTDASYFNIQDWDLVGEFPFKKQLWRNMIGQALNVKMKTENKRSTPCFGTIVWQFGEIWPTGGWGSIEYATADYTPGQVIGGRWKPLHYWYRKSLFTDVWVTCGGNGQCVIRNDGITALSNAVLTISTYTLSQSTETVLYTQNPLNMASGTGSYNFFKVDISSLNPTDNVLRGKVVSSTGQVLTDNFIPLLPPMNWTALPKATVEFTVSPQVNPDGTVDITVTTDKTAAFVTFTSLAQGRFSDNAFFMLPGTQTIQYIPFVTPTDISVLTTTLRVEHMALYV